VKFTKRYQGQGALLDTLTNIETSKIQAITSNLLSGHLHTVI